MQYHAVNKCKNHPVRIANIKCKQCNMPICQDCRVQVQEGVFCSEECIEKFKTFQDRISSIPPIRTGFTFFGLIKTLAISAVLIAVIFGALVFWMGTTDFGQMWVRFQDQWKLMF